MKIAVIENYNIISNSICFMFKIYLEVLVIIFNNE